jgi:triosephosphate isomerase
MYKTVHEAIVFVKEFRSLVKDIADGRDRLAPPFTALHAVAEAARTSNVGVAGRTCTPSARGRSRERVSAGMVKEAGAEYVIIGHSERRRLFGETDQTVNREGHCGDRRLADPIACIGETLEEREADQTLACSTAAQGTGSTASLGDQCGPWWLL